MKHTLSVVSGDRILQEHELTKPQVVLGRDPASDIVTDHPAISRRHAQLTLVDGGYVLEDLRSKAGVTINGMKITCSVPLNHGDRFEICQQIFVYHCPALIADEREDEGEGESTLLGSIAAVVNTDSMSEVDAQGKLRAMLRIAQALGRTLDLDILLAKMLDGLFDIFLQADRALILLCDGDRLVPKAAKNRNGDGQRIEYSKTIVEQAIRDRQAILSKDTGRDDQIPLSESILQLQIRSVMCVPLLSQDLTPLGVIQVDTQSRRRQFSAEDMEILASVANQASISVEYAQLHKERLELNVLRRDIELARRVQKEFLPKGTPELSAYDFWAHYRPARHVAGDFYDFVRLPNGQYAVLLGDVAGKGIPAALMMAKASTVCKVALLSHPDSLADAMGRINDEICEMPTAVSFITLVICRINPETHEIELASAGHMSPIFRRIDGTIDEPIDNDTRGYPLGVEENQQYGACTTTLHPGESVVIYSDGIHEAEDSQREPYSIQRIHEQLQGCLEVTAAEIGRSLLADVHRHLGDCEPNDDVSLVVFRRALT